jgi:hypothetical protein
MNCPVPVRAVLHWQVPIADPEASEVSQLRHCGERPQAPLRLGYFHFSDWEKPSRNYSTSKWSLFSDGSSLTAFPNRSRSFLQEG